MAKYFPVHSLFTISSKLPGQVWQLTGKGTCNGPKAVCPLLACEVALRRSTHSQSVGAERTRAEALSPCYVGCPPHPWTISHLSEFPLLQASLGRFTQNWQSVIFWSLFVLPVLSRKQLRRFRMFASVSSKGPEWREPCWFSDVDMVWCRVQHWMTQWSLWPRRCVDTGKWSLQWCKDSVSSDRIKAWEIHRDIFFFFKMSHKN